MPMRCWWMRPTPNEMLVEHIRRYYPGCVVKRARRVRKKKSKAVELVDPQQLALLF